LIAVNRTGPNVEDITEVVPFAVMIEEDPYQRYEPIATDDQPTAEGPRAKQ
jgi:hypothetical protein